MSCCRKIETVVLTGPTGAIGTALIRKCIRENIEVYAVVRPGSARAGAVPKHDLVHTVELDLSELETLPRKISRQADAFFHLGWAGTVGDARNDMPVQIENVRGTITAVHAAAALGCRVFVGAGSQAEYGRVEGALKPETPCFPENGYGMAKLCAGQMSRVECQKHGMAHIWVRVLSVYGPGDGKNSMISSVIRQLLAGAQPALTAGEQLWDYLYADDAAAALLLSAERGVDGKVYVLGKGTASPLREYVQLLRDAVDPGLPLGFGQVPYGPKQVMHLQADISTLQEDTGFVPQTEFAEGIRKTIEWVKDECRG